MCKLIRDKQTNICKLRATARIRLIISVLSGIFLLAFFPVHAIDVGKAISIEGSADYRTDYTNKEMQLELIKEGLGIEVKYLLQTRPSESKVEILLLFGHIYTIGEGSQVSVIDDLGNNHVAFSLKEGVIRAVTSRSGGIRFVTTTTWAQIVALKSGYMVSCGPPATANLDTCLFVGLYGQSEAKSYAFPDQAVVLERQFYTYIQKGKAPYPSPPKKLDTLQFQELINKTTLVGTGKEKDHLSLIATDELSPGYSLPPLWPQKEPQPKIPDVPLEDFKPLPLPPVPPL